MVPDTSAPCQRDKGDRQFRALAPNLLWVSDFTSVSTWEGFIHVAFVLARSLIALPDGGSRGLSKLILCEVLWNRLCMIEGQFRQAD